jgi:hypothetical protein
LASPRAQTLAGAARVSLDAVELLGQPRWSFGAPVTPGLALSELVIAGLLRRSDIRFVERRRFAAAALAERNGEPRASGAPPAGVSEGAELIASVVWVPLPTGVSIEVRLAEAARGAVIGTRRATLPADADIVSTARTIVGTIVAALESVGRLPAWTDPVGEAATARSRESGVPDAAVASFLRGLAAEETWRWEAARASYQQAAATVGFFEAEAALARAARLRLGGTLGES